MAVLGVFLSLVLCLCCLRFEKSVRGSKSDESLLPSVFLLEAGSCCGLCPSGHVWFFSGVIPHATWRCRFGEALCSSPHSPEDSQWRMPGGWKEMGIMSWSSNSPRYSWGTSGLLPFHEAAELLPVYTESLVCMVSARALVSRTLWPTRESLPYRALCSRTGLGHQCAPRHCFRVIWQDKCQQMLIFRCPGMAVLPLRPRSPRQQRCALSSLMCDPAACIILQGVNRRLKGRLCGHCFQYPSC